MNLQEIFGGINMFNKSSHIAPPPKRLFSKDFRLLRSPLYRFWIDFIDFGAILNTSLRGAKRRGNPLIYRLSNQNKTLPNPVLLKEGIYPLYLWEREEFQCEFLRALEIRVRVKDKVNKI